MQHGYPDKNLQFLKEKINDIKIALFRSELNPGLQLPNNIVQTLNVDDEGTVWFFTSCNGNHVENIDRPFYAYLSYQKKGTGCRLQVSGKACIVKNDDAGIFSMQDYSKGNYGRLVLVKMKIMQAEFFENKPSENISWGGKIKNSFAHFFMTPHRIYNFVKHTG
ncbi:MAG: pyridoxamine 5'-phosphate oxidase family protein [Ferruginibacter sp.]